MEFPEGPVREWVKAVLLGVFEPEPDEEIWEWAERTLKIPATENEEMANKLWRSYYSPYVREIMEFVKAPGKGEFWIKKSSQVGFTMAVLIIICWMIVYRSGQVGYAIDSVEEARKISKTRLKKWIENNDLLDEVNGSEDDLSNLTYYLKGLTVYLQGAYSAGAWANKSIVLFILDELDKHEFIAGEGTTSDLARERCKRPKNAKIIGFSSPGKSGLITKEHAAGTCEVIRFPWPCCDHVDDLRWDNFIFGDKEFRDLAGAYDLQKVQEEAYFKCESCGGRLLDHQKMEAMQSYTSVATNPKAVPGVRSMHVWDAYSAFVTFGDLAIEWIKAQGDPSKIERFMRGRRGLEYIQNGGKLSESELLDLRAPYRRGECPDVDVCLYAMSVDLQEINSEKKCTKSVFTPEGDEYVIDWRICITFDEVVEFADEPLVTPRDGTINVITGLLDEGNDKDDVRSFCLNNTRFYPVKGRGEGQSKALVTNSPQWHEGMEIDTYHVDDREFKWQLLNMLRRETYSEKRKGTLKKIRFPEDVIKDESFFEELCQEYPVREKNRFGVPGWKWKRTSKPNDWWDTLKYNRAIWAICGVGMVRSWHALRAMREQEAAELAGNSG